MKKTIEYYNDNAESYYSRTVEVDFRELYERFLECIPEGGRIMDVGCGSGRDVAAFCKMGYCAEGIDASEKLAAVAREKLNIKVNVCSMGDWIAEKPYDGIWCCASLLHLEDRQINRFLGNLKNNLKEGGAIFISVKTGIKTGSDDKGRYFRNFTQEDLSTFIEIANKNGARLRIQDVWETDDGMEREVKWLNCLAVRT